MSLAQLSMGIVTKGALHLIERGKSRPSLRVLEAIAERTGKPLSFFLAPHEIVRLKALTPDSGDLGLANLELLYERDLYPDCLREASEIAERWRNTEHEVGARYWRARALLMTGAEGAAQEAIGEARWVLDRWRGGGDAARLTEALDCLASAQYVAQSSDDALRTATQALEAARLVQPANPRLLGKVLAHLAAIQIARHDWDAALKAYADAAEALEGLTDLARSAQMYEGMALAHTNLGNVAEALKYCNRAISLYSRKNEQISLANARNTLGWLLLKRGDLQRADGQLQESARLFESLGVRQRTASVYHSIGELRLRQGNLDEANSAATKSLALARSLGEPANAASAHILQARIAEERAEHAEADGHLREAIALLSSSKDVERLIEAHTRYAEVLKRRGDSARAAEEFEAALVLARPHAGDEGGRLTRGDDATEAALA
jgi:tetratricopeptide (TPR) repeat protein